MATVPHNVTVASEEQARHIASLVRQMKDGNRLEVEPTHEAVENWTALCEHSSEGKIWLRCNNWYMKTTKTDAAAGRERSAGMWMGTFPDYLKHLAGNESGAPEKLLRFV